MGVPIVRRNPPTAERIRPTAERIPPSHPCRPNGCPRATAPESLVPRDRQSRQFGYRQTLLRCVSLHRTTDSYDCLTACSLIPNRR